MTPEFNEWWDSDDVAAENPYDIGNPIYWAWEGWQAALKTSKWVGLTEAEVDDLLGNMSLGSVDEDVRLIEAKLKEKNTHATKPNQDPCGND